MKDLNQQITEDIGSLLKEDSLAIAEQIAGKSYKEDKNIAWLGMALMQDKGKKLNALLEVTGDSKFRNTLKNYQNILEKENFKQLIKLPFYCQEWNMNDEFYVYFNYELGILCVFDTYNGNVNSAKIYYNWKPNNWDEAHEFTSSGGAVTHYKNKDEAKWPDDYVWAGDHDAREAIRYKIGQLKQNGSFVTPWIRQPFLWLLNYNDTKDKNYDYKKINLQRFDMLPKEVWEAIKGQN